MRILAIFFLLLTVTRLQAQETTLFIKTGKFYDSEKGQFLTNQDILIEKGLIIAVGKNLKKPKKARLIDLSTCTVTPGLMDAHTHILLHQKPTNDGMTIASKVPASERIERGIAFADEYLRTGFTMIRDVGNSGQFLDVQVKNRLLQQGIPSPEMRVSGPILSPPGGQFWGLAPADTFLITQEYRVVKGADDARAAVLEHIRQGVDVIKVCMNADNRVLAPEEIKAIVATAHQHKIPVTAHATYDESARDAVLAGVNGIEHGYSLSDSTLTLMAQRGTYLVPTDVSWKQGKIRVAATGMKGEEADKYLKENLNAFHDRLRRAVKKGVTIVAGADYYNDFPGTGRGEGSIDVILSYIEAGIPVQQVLQFATLNAARALGIAQKTGVLKKGMKADLAAFNGDMETDFAKSLFNLKMVIKDGNIVRINE